MGEGFEGGMETSTDSAPTLEAGAEPMESIETPSVESFDMPEDSGGFEGVDNEESGILDQIGDNNFEEYNTDDIEMKTLLQNCYNTVKNYSLANCADSYLKNILEFM